MITALLLAAAALLFANPEHLKAIREAVRQKAAAACSAKETAVSSI